MALINLKVKEATQLEQLVTTANDARQILRAQALLWLDEGESVEEVAERLQVSRQSIYNWVLRFQERSSKPVEVRVADGARAGRPATAKGVIDSLIDLIIDSDPRDFGYRQTVWTASLLQTYLSQVHQLKVSSKSIGRAIERLGISWKRPRHTLASQDPHWGQAKGGSNAASGKTRDRSS
jgi:transposase